MKEKHYFEKHENGKYYMYSENCPDTPICCGNGGTCGTTLDPKRHDPLCPACQAQKNARKAVEKLDNKCGNS